MALVMGAAVPVAALGYRVARRRAVPLCAARFDAPTRRTVDARLAAGALTFGVGWGLAGYCPGPARASLSFGGWQAALFTAFMFIGMMTFRLGQMRQAAVAAQ